MIQTQTLQRRPWRRIGWLLAIAVGVVVAAVNLYAGAVVMAVLMAWATAHVLAHRRIAQVVATPMRTPPQTRAWPAVVRRTISTDDGAAHAAIVVEAECTPGYQTVITSAGYVLVNDAGRVVYTLKPFSALDHD